MWLLAVCTGKVVGASGGQQGELASEGTGRGCTGVFSSVGTVYICMYVSMYIWRERERERER